MSTCQAEQLLTLEKTYQKAASTHCKPRRIIANGADMYCQTNRSHDFLLASERPASGSRDRQTRTSRLRSMHREQGQSACIYNAAKIEFNRKKQRPESGKKTQDRWLPTTIQLCETPRPFLVGTRYNCSNYTDLRTFANLGLYVSRVNPATTFLKRNYRAPSLDLFASAESIENKDKKDRSTSICIPDPSQRSPSTRSNSGSVKVYLQKYYGSRPQTYSGSRRVLLSKNDGTAMDAQHCLQTRQIKSPTETLHDF